MILAAKSPPLKNIHSYAILPKIGLIIQYHEGNLTAKDIKNTKLQIINDPTFQNHYVHLVDISNTKILMDKEELGSLGTWIAQNVPVTGLGRFAILAESKEQIVAAMIYALNENLTNQYYETFGSIYAAIRWLNLNTSNKAEIENSFHKIKQ